MADPKEPSEKENLGLPFHTSSAWMRKLHSLMPEVMTYQCPFCDREVRVGEPCPGCDKKQKPSKRPSKKSWQQEKSYDGLDLPDDDFDYDEFVAREFGGKPHRKLGVKWYWWLLGVALLILMALFAVNGLGVLSAAETSVPAMVQTPGTMCHPELPS